MNLFSFLRPKSAIYVVNEATVVSDGTVKLWCKAVATQIKRDVAPVWGKPAKTVRFISSPAAAPKNAWVIAVLDDSDQSDSLGYHSTDDRGRVYGRVFAKTAQDYGYDASQTFSHEVLETWGDPGVDRWVLVNGRISVPLELCDAVEGDEYVVSGVTVSNFVYPMWFREPNHSGLYGTDHLGTTSGPFKLAKNGYTVRRYPDGHTDQVFGATYNEAYGQAKSHGLGRGKRRQ